MIKQGQLVGVSDEEERCSEFLRDRGYIILPPSRSVKEVLSEEDYSAIKNVNGLVEFFYKRLCYLSYALVI